MSLAVAEGYRLVKELGFSPRDMVLAGSFSAAAQGYGGNRPIGDVDLLLWTDKAEALSRSGDYELVEAGERRPLQGSLAYHSRTLTALYRRTSRGKYDTSVEIGSVGTYPYGVLVPGAQEIWDQAVSINGLNHESTGHVIAFKEFYGRLKDKFDLAYYKQIEASLNAGMNLEQARQREYVIPNGLIVPRGRPATEGMRRKFESTRPPQPSHIEKGSNLPRRAVLFSR